MEIGPGYPRKDAILLHDKRLGFDKTLEDLKWGIKGEDSLLQDMISATQISKSCKWRQSIFIHIASISFNFQVLYLEARVLEKAV